MKIDFPSHLSDDDLVAQVKSPARCEREATACLIAHLAELDDRRLYLGAGFSSLFTYCCSVLHLSEPAAYNRIEAARAARRFPVENHQELLAAAAGKSKRDVEELLVRYFPRPEVPSLVRKLPAPRALPAPSAATPPSAPEKAAAI